MPPSLDLVVTSVATRLMEATAFTATKVSEEVLAQLVEQIDVDASFLRHHDQDIRASVLVAEWPPRTHVPDPDPVAVVHFAGADPVLAQCKHGRKPVVIRPDQNGHTLPRWLTGAKTPTSPSVAAAPLVRRGVTTGVLGFVKFGARKWKQEEINTLEAVAALFAQLQGRLAAEEQLRYLAEHDDLTGLCNRRAAGREPFRKARRRTKWTRRGPLSRPRPAQADQRLPRPHRGRLVHPGVRRPHSGVRGKPEHDRPAGWG